MHEVTLHGEAYQTPNFKRHNLVNVWFLLEHFRRYSIGTDKSADLKITCLLFKCSLLAAV